MTAGTVFDRTRTPLTVWFIKNLEPHGKKGTQDERGSELVEFALVFPLLLMVVLAIVDFGFMFQRYEVVTNAAREGESRAPREEGHAG